MGLSIPGMGSGLDIKSMVDSLVKADMTRLQVRHDKQSTKVNTELSALGQLKSVVSNLQTTLTNLSNIGQLNAMKYNLSDQSYVIPTVYDQAKPGTYQIQVQQLAQAQSLASGYFTNNTDPVGTGNLTINFGTYSDNNTVFTANPDTTVQPLTLTLADGDNSLSAICDAINKSDAAVTANIVQDSMGSRLSITSSKTGVDYAMQITGDITALNYDPTTNTNALTESMPAINSIVQLNGLTVTQDSNQLDDVLSGVSLTLKKADATQTITLTVEANKEQLTNSLNDFIKKYNDCMTFLYNLTGFNKETKQAGFYQGDTQLREFKLALHKWVTTPPAVANGSIQKLSDLGINTTKTGMLELNQEKYTAAFSKNYAEIGTLFAKSINASDPTLQMCVKDTKIPVGIYDVVLDEFTPGTSMSGTIGGLPATSKDGITLNGTGILSGLAMKVTSGTTGPRGQITVTDGLAPIMGDLLDTFIGKSGNLEHRTESLTKKMTALTGDQKTLDDRSAYLEKRYLKQWNNVDLVLAKMQETGGMLTQVLSNLPQMNRKK